MVIQEQRMNFSEMTYEEWVEELKKGNAQAAQRPPRGWYKRLSIGDDRDKINPHALIYMQDYFLSKAD